MLHAICGYAGVSNSMLAAHLSSSYFVCVCSNRHQSAHPLNLSNTYEHENVHRYAHTYTLTHVMHTNIKTFIHTHIRTYLHTYIHTYTYVHIYIHAYSQTSIRIDTNRCKHRNSTSAHIQLLEIKLLGVSGDMGWSLGGV